eukprot:CAMPEP_0182908504 /NCGR_PEP_ID=MMETSP0034_2-20130328/35249_1 /TAXON_ID=156128 /ORGANISM="Nephroselmis pyriformis, Strain CCMP717" /LENGTH=45 /DNA_ID= /DNA_START= /DNA_END= /DNA_ORIENTATION=
MTAEGRGGSWTSTLTSFMPVSLRSREDGTSLAEDLDDLAEILEGP